MAFDVARIRGLFPALGDGWIHLDASAGMQVPEQVATAVSTAMRAPVSGPGGAFPASQRAEAIVDAAQDMSSHQRLDFARELQAKIRVTLHDGSMVSGHTLGQVFGDDDRWPEFVRRRDGTRCRAWLVGGHAVPDDVQVEFVDPDA